MAPVTVPGGGTADRALPCRTAATGPVTSNRSSVYRLLLNTHDNCRLWVLSVTPSLVSRLDFREIQEGPEPGMEEMGCPLAHCP